MKITAIITAGGSGTRANLGKNKILYELDGECVLARTISAFEINSAIDNIVVGACEDDIEEIKKICINFSKCKVISGGKSRSMTVKNALNACDCDTDIVLIHDGARPFVTQRIINTCIDSVGKFGSGICSLCATDTHYLKSKTSNTISSIDREQLRSVQTPQGFTFKNIKYAYSKVTERDSYTDDTAVFVACFNETPRFFEGEKSNIKLTYKEDFEKNDLKVGVGIDTHAFGSSDLYITLGGVQINCDTGLVAHSDGDVLIHSIMDAMLSSVGLDDIGHYFPDTEEKWKNADSLKMLKKVNELLNEQGYKVNNISSAIQAQKPKLAKYIAEMKNNIAQILNIDNSQIGISAGTNEKLGYIGRGEGITVTSYISVRRL